MYKDLEFEKIAPEIWINKENKLFICRLYDDDMKQLPGWFLCGDGGILLEKNIDFNPLI